MDRSVPIAGGVLIAVVIALSVVGVITRDAPPPASTPSHGPPIALASPSEPPLAGTSWVLDWEASAIDAGVRDQHRRVVGEVGAGITFDGRDVEAWIGMGGGCGDWTAPYTTDGRVLTLGPIQDGWGCDYPQVRILADRLAAAIEVHRVRSTLTLFDEAGAGLVFRSGD